MAARKDNLPLTLDCGNDTTGTITYANEVIAIIAGVATNEVDGIAGMCSSGISEVFGRNKNITKGVRIELGTEEVAVDVYLIVEYGTPIQTAAFNVQENVRKAIESMTGLHVVRVDVHVQGVSFEKERQESSEQLHSLDSLQKMKDLGTFNNKVVFDGEPTPAESHEPSYVDSEIESMHASQQTSEEKESIDNE